jgi:hypothetical protein
LNDELKQSVLDAVIERPLIVGTASGGTAITGVSTWLELIPTVLGCIASLTGILVSLGLFYFSWQKHKAEMKKLRLATNIIERREEERQNGKD